jgi:hypothetical protein
MIPGAAQIPASLLHDFYESRALPQSTRVWIISTSVRHLAYIDHRTITVRREDLDPPPGSNAFATLIGVGHVGFYVLSWRGPKPTIDRIYDRFGSAVIPIFPSRGPIIWPPRDPFTKEGLNQFAGVFGSWEDEPPRAPTGSHA